MKTNLLPIIALTTALGLAPEAAAISLSSLDDFAATTEGWSIGGAGVQPTRDSGLSFDSQPGFLEHFSDGASANGKWLMWTNQADWLGNYTAAGVTEITFQADNQAGSPLDLRIAFNGPGGWFHSEAQTIANATAGADWTLLSFTLDAGNFSYVAGSGGNGSFASTLAGVTRFEIFGGAGPITFRSGGNLLESGTSINTVGIDEIQAVPEPSALGILFAGLGASALRRRRRKGD